MSLSLTAPLRAGPALATALPAPAPVAPRRAFGEFLRPPAAPSIPAASPPAAAPAPAPAMPIAGQLLQRVARGERQLEALVRQAVSGRSFTPQELLVVQAQVYRYTQELDLLGKLIDKGTSTVRTVLQQNG